MNLKDLQKRDGRKKPIKMVLYGDTKVGKTTFASGAPGCCFIALEPGLVAVDAPFWQPETLDDVRGVLRSLKNDPHDFKTLVVDSLDWLEPIIHGEVCKAAGVKVLADVAYGKLYEKVPLVWREILSMVDSLQASRGMHFIGIGHSAIRNVVNPDGTDYAKVDLKLLESKSVKISQLVQEWADAIAYARHEVSVNEEQKKARGTGSRILDFGPNPAFTSGCRYPIESRVALDWTTFYKAWERAVPRPTDEIVADLRKLLDRLPKEDQEKVEAIIAERAPGRLQKLLNRVQDKVGDK
jgi:hypothetical protein